MALLSSGNSVSSKLIWTRRVMGGHCLSAAIWSISMRTSMLSTSVPAMLLFTTFERGSRVHLGSIREELLDVIADAVWHSLCPQARHLQ